MSISYRNVYLARSISDVRVCSLSDISLYATHLFALFESASYACPSRIALEIANEKVTYEVLSQKVNLCVSGLQVLGIEQGDAVIVSAEKSISCIASLLAVLKIGAKICLLPQALSALRLQSIQKIAPVALHINASGSIAGTQGAMIDFCTQSARTISYEQLLSLGLSDESITVDHYAFMTAAQLFVRFDEKNGLYTVELAQADFLKAISKLDDIPSFSESGQRVLISTDMTKPCFLLEIFYVFAQQLTCVLVDKQSNAAIEPRFMGRALTLRVIHAARLFLDLQKATDHCSNGIEVQGQYVASSEIEYFACQYPGVKQAKAIVTAEAIELQLNFSWDFYALPIAQSVTKLELNEPQTDSHRLACRVVCFLSQHLWPELPIKTIILLPE